MSSAVAVIRSKISQAATSIKQALWRRKMRKLWNKWLNEPKPF